MKEECPYCLREKTEGDCCIYNAKGDVYGVSLCMNILV